MRAPIIPTDATPSTSLTHMRRILSGLGALAALATIAACSDAPSAPQSALAPGAAPARNTVSSVISQRSVGDTVITEFVVGTNTSSPASINIGHSSKVDFPYASGSICDPATSSYGAGTWNSPCAATKTGTRITAKTWRTATGKVATDFQPALRFVPGLRKTVVLTLKNANDAARIDYCTLSGCIDESIADPSLVTRIDPNNGFAYRTIKHFSGYQIILGREGEEGTEGQY